MSGPTRLNEKHFFYPFGNTPAVNLLQSRRPLCEIDDPVRVLLLGCGDPRNLLFTLWCNEDEQIKWDFICCDSEIAILARNILLFSFIIDNAPYASIWNIFYHFYITDVDNALLQTQISKLIDQSANLEVWSSSVYGASISFMNQDTLDLTREIWTRYLEATNFEPGSKERDHFETKFKSEVESTKREQYVTKEGIKVKDGRKQYASGLRSAGGNWENSIQTVVDAFEGFWDHGVIAGNSQDVEALARDGRRVNPLMTIISAGNLFSIPSSSDPLLGFRLASAFDDENSSQAELKENAVRLAKAQFQEWSKSFREKVRHGRITVRLYCGDALRFSYALQSLRDHGNTGTNILSLYTAAWRSNPLVLDNFDTSKDLHAFDIIDTNNLADLLGILNLLPAISPLLSRKTTSILFTETLFMYAQDPVDTLSHILCSNITTMSLLLGLAPSGHLFGFTTYAVGLDAQRQFSVHRNNTESYHLRIEWRCPNLEDPAGRRLVFEPQELAQFFFKLYLKMFDIELISPTTGREIDRQKYNRLSFASLVCLAKGCIKNDELSAFGECLLKLIERDNTLHNGALQLLELSMHFYQLGICSQPSILELPREIMLANLKGFKDGPLSIPDPNVDASSLAQQNIPDVVWIWLSVPQDDLKSIKSHSQYSSVGLQIKIWHTKSKTEAHFMSLQCFFGSLIQRSGDNDIYNAIEDKFGLKGSSNLVVTCAVPSLVLMIDSKESTRIELAYLNTEASMELFGQRSKCRMAICSYRLDDENVLIMKHPPGIELKSKTIAHAATRPTPLPSRDLCFIRMKDNSSVETMEIRKKFEHSEAERAIRARQISPCTISERLNGMEITQVQFPYPISLHEATIDFSKKIKTLIAKPSLALDDMGYNLDSFPIVLKGSDAYCLTLHKVNLNQQPIISAVGPKTTEWISNLMHSMFSARERSYWHESKNMIKENATALFAIKKYIENMVVSFVQPSSLGRKQTFVFESSGSRCISMIIFVSALRHNIDQNSVVLDAYVLPLQGENPSIAPVLETLLAYGNTQPVSYDMRHIDEQLMRKMLPATVEACRKNWNHGPSCRYRQYNSISSYTESNQSPICSCGEGKDAEDFPHIKGWEILSKRTTRIALMPLSTVDYVEAHYSQEEHEKYEEELRAMTTSKDYGINLQKLRIVDRVVVVDFRACKRCGDVPCVGIEHKLCSRCKGVRYCGEGCQKADWKNHKKVCKAPLVGK
ncbi:hypothetical protein EAF04_009278 [Stromatinia cepivora]|nr:hypothetical protein EAF04_009278 [Stromatinia cepivora]